MLRRKEWALFALALALATSVAVAAQEPSSRARLLLVDETKTFSSTMRVGVLAGVLKRSGLADITVVLAEVGSNYDDPLAGREDLAGPYDVIVLIPRGIDDGTNDWIWIIANMPGESSPGYPAFATAIDALSTLIERVFSGLARPIDGRQDLFPALLAALYVQEGILR